MVDTTRQGRSLGGRAAAARLTPAERHARASRAAKARWEAVNLRRHAQTCVAGNSMAAEPAKRAPPWWRDPDRRGLTTGKWR